MLKKGEELKVSQEELLKWLRDTYFALDGLWFLVVEEERGLNEAVRLDFKVWERLALILAKRIKRKFNLPDRVDQALSSLSLFFNIEGWKVNFAFEERGFKVEGCPWWGYLIKVGRKHVAERVCPKVCELIFNSWVKVFDPKATVRFTFNPPNCQASFKVD